MACVYRPASIPGASLGRAHLLGGAVVFLYEPGWKKVPLPGLDIFVSSRRTPDSARAHLLFGAYLSHAIRRRGGGHRGMDRGRRKGLVEESRAGPARGGRDGGRSTCVTDSAPGGSGVVRKILRRHHR